MKVAVVGCGPWGQNIIRTLLELEETEEFTLQEIVHTGNQERAETVWETFRVECHTSLDEALERNDALVVASPDETHPDITRRALKTGTDVFVEKPLAFDHQTAGELYRLAEDNDCQLMPGHLMLFHPILVELSHQPEFIDSDPGEIMIDRMSDLRERGERRLLHSSLIHDISVLDYHFEREPNRIIIHEIKGSYPPGDLLLCQLVYGETVVQIRARSDWPFPVRTTVWEVEGCYFRFDGIEESLDIVDPADGTTQRRSVTGDSLPLTDELKNFVRACRGEERCRITRDHVHRVMRTLDSIEEKVLEELKV